MIRAEAVPFERRQDKRGLKQGGGEWWTFPGRNHASGRRLSPRVGKCIEVHKAVSHEFAVILDRTAASQFLACKTREEMTSRSSCPRQTADRALRAAYGRQRVVVVRCFACFCLPSWKCNRMRYQARYGMPDMGWKGTIRTTGGAGAVDGVASANAATGCFALFVAGIHACISDDAPGR